MTRIMIHLVFLCSYSHYIIIGFCQQFLPIFAVNYRFFPQSWQNYFLPCQSANLGGWKTFSSHASNL